VLGMQFYQTRLKNQINARQLTDPDGAGARSKRGSWESSARRGQAQLFAYHRCNVVCKQGPVQHLQAQ